MTPCWEDSNETVIPRNNRHKGETEVFVECRCLKKEQHCVQCGSLEDFPDCVEKCKFLKVGEDVAGKDKRALS